MSHRLRPLLGALLCTLTSVALVLGLTPAAPAPAEAAPPSVSLCDHTWSGLKPYNPIEDVRRGYYGTPGHRSIKVADGGDVDWTLDPFGSLTWTMWLDTLGWAGTLIDSYDATGNQSDLDLALTYAHDYVVDQPMHAYTPDRPVLQQTSRRLQFFVCLYERAPATWLEQAMQGTVDFLAANWAGAYNHGLDQDQAILTAGCTLDRPDWIAYARARLSRTLAASIDAQGGTNEQSTGYAYYTYRRWLVAAGAIKACGLAPLPGLGTKLAKARSFIAHSTRPDGVMVPIGDTAPDDPGLPGFKGLALSYAWVQAGFVFGRSSWDRSTDPAHYSLRFGAPRQIHGGADHGSASLYANGTPIVTEPGSIGYVWARSPWFQRAPEAHNILLWGDGRCAATRTSDLTRQRRTGRSDHYSVSTPWCAGRVAERDVSFNRPKRRLRVDDTTSRSASKQAFQQLWHLTPGTKVTRKRLSAYHVRLTLTMPNRSQASVVVKSIKRGKAVKVRTKRGKLVRRKKDNRSRVTVTVVSGRYAPYQGWVSGGVGRPVAAPVIVVSQRAKAANIRTTIRTR